MLGTVSYCTNRCELAYWGCCIPSGYVREMEVSSEGSPASERLSGAISKAGGINWGSCLQLPRGGSVSSQPCSSGMERGTAQPRSPHLTPAVPPPYQGFAGRAQAGEAL